MKILCCCLSRLFALGSVSPSFAAQSTKHVVAAQELRAALAAQSSERQEDIAAIRALLNHATVREQLGGIANRDKVEASIANLDDATLQQLGARARQVTDDVAAGANATVVVLVVVAVIVASILLNLVPAEF